MLRSHKVDACDCKEKKALSCSHPGGKCDVGRPYRLLRIFDSDGAVSKATHKRTEMLQQDMKLDQLLLLASLRISKPKSEAPKPKIEATFHAERFFGAKSDQDKKINRKSVEDEQIKEQIAGVIKLLFGDSQVIRGSIVFESASETYTVNSNSKYCWNLDGEHNSEKQYYIITRWDIEKRCHCRCEKHHNRTWGLCKDFFVKVPTSASFQAALFSRNQDLDLSSRPKLSQATSKAQTRPNDNLRILLYSEKAFVACTRSLLKSLMIRSQAIFVSANVNQVRRKENDNSRCHHEVRFAYSFTVPFKRLFA
jgi:hypothetical protein